MKHPSFGVAGSTKREFCAGHAKGGMIDLTNMHNKKCSHQGCTKHPSFGVAGSTKREFCAGHAKEGMIDLLNKKCEHQGCTKGPSFGVAGTTKRVFCAGHAKEGMVNVRGRREGSSSTRASRSSATPPTHSGLPLKLRIAGVGGSSNSGTVRRPKSNLQRKSGTRPSAPPPTRRSNAAGKGRLEEPFRSNGQAGQYRLPVATPAGHDQDQGIGDVQDPAVVAWSFTLSQDHIGDDDVITTTATIKTEEEVVLSSCVVVPNGDSGREGGTVRRHSDGNGRGGKRKGRALPSSSQTTTGGDASGGKSSRQSHSKRARAACDDGDVVVLEPGDEGVAAARTAGAGTGAVARVAIKAER